MKGDLGNIVGPQIRRFRYNRGWSQAKLAVRLQIAGFDISRESLAKVEIQIHKVEDYQLPYYSRALGVPLEQLFPPLPSDKPIHDTIARLRSNRDGATLRKPAGVVNGASVLGMMTKQPINGCVRRQKQPASIEQQKQMALPLVQIRTEAK